MAKYYYTNMISALATGQISYRDAMCEILKRLCDLENDKVQNQADWTETDSTSPSYIQHKPSVQEFQADWNETNSTVYGYIQNKPKVMDGTINTQPQLVPPNETVSNILYLTQVGLWDRLFSLRLYWNGLSGSNIQNFNIDVQNGQAKANWTETNPDSPSFIQNKPTLQSALYPRASWSRYTQCFAYLQALPAGANNTWGCQIVQEWIPGKFWHFKGWVFKNIANNSSITTPFFNYGINLDCVVEHTDLTAEQFAIAYNDNRVYSVAKKIDGYQIDGGTDWFGRVNLTDTEIGGVMICNYDGDATTGYKGVLRFGGWKYSGSTMALTDYPLAQQGIGAFEFDIWVNSAS